MPVPAQTWTAIIILKVGSFTCLRGEQWEETRSRQEWADLTSLQSLFGSSFWVRKCTEYKNNSTRFSSDPSSFPQGTPPNSPPSVDPSIVTLSSEGRRHAHTHTAKLQTDVNTLLGTRTHYQHQASQHNNNVLIKQTRKPDSRHRKKASLFSLSLPRPVSPAHGEAWALYLALGPFLGLRRTISSVVRVPSPHRRSCKTRIPRLVVVVSRSLVFVGPHISLLHTNGTEPPPLARLVLHDPHRRAPAPNVPRVSHRDD